jgi:glycosyltransferase involved in cell wall biosynthesis
VLISIVIPVCNESSNLNEISSRLQKILSETGHNWEAIFVDDGSTDDSWEIMSRLHKDNPSFRGIRLARNFGQQAAISAGLRHARGDVVIPMDADLQDPPETIPTLLEKWTEGYQVVYSRWRHRKEGIIKRLTAALFYRVLDRIADVNINLDSSDFCLMDRQVVDAINRLPERRPFIRGLRSWVGFRHIGITIDRGSRQQGESKYSFRKLSGLALDGIFSFAITPIRFAIYIGLMCAILGIAGLVWAAVIYIGGADAGHGSIPYAGLILFLGGLQLACIGIIGEFIGRIFDQVKGRPPYVIQETLPSTSFEP